MLEFLLGVDGGGTGTRALLARPDGSVLGRGAAGPSALGQGIEQAWRHISEAVAYAFADALVPVAPWQHCAMGAGLSGVHNPAWTQAFTQANPGLAQLELVSDATTMLLGAHGGQSGMVLTAGTGSVGEARLTNGQMRSAGGWGFPVGDEGSGAWLGLQAMRHAQCAMDGRSTPGPLAHAVWAQCGSDRHSLQAWCGQAAQFTYAQLAPRVFENAATDPVAQALLQQAAQALAELAGALDTTHSLPVCICGSIGQRLEALLPPDLRTRCRPAQNDPLAGALHLIQERLRSFT